MRVKWGPILVVSSLLNKVVMVTLSEWGLWDEWGEWGSLDVKVERGEDEWWWWWLLLPLWWSDCWCDHQIVSLWSQWKAAAGEQGVGEELSVIDELWSRPERVRWVAAFDVPHRTGSADQLIHSPALVHADCACFGAVGVM